MTDPFDPAEFAAQRDEVRRSQFIDEMKARRRRWVLIMVAVDVILLCAVMAYYVLR